MKWINHLLNLKTPIYIYKLNKGDSIIYHQNTKPSKTLIILNGLVYISKIFTNKEAKTLAILDTGNIIYHKHISHTNYYYKIIAITETFFLSFQWEDLILENNCINSNLFIEFIQLYTETIHKYERMNNILAHKYIKNRVIQLILMLSKDFGKIENKQIIIPYYISQITISLITGSNKTTVNKILHYLSQNKLIEYSYDRKISIKNPLLLIYYKNRKN